MKKKSLFAVLAALICASLCAFAFTACSAKNGSNDKKNNVVHSNIELSFNEQNGELTFASVASAVNYEIYLCEYQKEPIKYVTQSNSYRFEKLTAGDYRITVLAVSAEGVETASGSISLSLKSNVGMPQAPLGVKVENGVLSWEGEASSYIVEAVNNGTAKSQKSGITERSLNLTELALSAGIYELNVYGVNDSGVKGTAGTVRYTVYGASAFGKEKSNGEYYLADFRQSDDLAFTSVDGATLIDDEGKVGLAYTDALWFNVGVWYTLPEAINWNEVYQLKIRTRLSQANPELESKACYAYLFNEDGKFNGIYPGDAWSGNGVEKVENDGDGWVVTTFSAENIRLRGIDYDNDYDYYWQYGEAEKLIKILFAATGQNASVEVDYITYTKRKSAEDFDITYKNAELKAEYTTVDKFDWSLLLANGADDYTVDYRLERSGVKVEFEKEQRLAAGDYKLIAIVRGEYYGRVEKSFKVIESDLTVPGGVSSLRYDANSETLTWSATENAEKYRITAKRLDGSLIESVNAETSATECKIQVPVGKTSIIVTPVSADGVEGRDVIVQVLNLGNAKFATPKNPADEYCTCLNVAAMDNADYAAFLTGHDDETITFENGGISVSDNTVDPNGKTWAMATLEFPVPLDVKNKNFVLSFNFIGGATDGTYQIYLCNESGKTAYCYANGGYTEGGGLPAIKTENGVKIRVSAQRILEKNYYCNWQNLTAETITKIEITSKTSGFVLGAIEMSEEPGVISGVSAQALGYAASDVIVADFGESSDRCQNAYIENGELIYKNGSYSFTLGKKIDLIDATAIKLCVKGNVYIRLVGSDGNVFDGGPSWGSGYIGYAWGIKDCNTDISHLTAEDDNGYKILTLDKAAFKATDIIRIELFPEANGIEGVIDYIVAEIEEVSEGGEGEESGDGVLTYTITYDLGINKYATLGSAAQTVVYGKAFVLQTPVYSGSATFYGWYIADENGKATNQKFESGIYNLAKSVTLVAVWEEWSPVVS